jgi:predicted unusual protein kinase regulating ubiquinone biosynthesis (AarF/ABC1/UbiB family)
VVIGSYLWLSFRTRLHGEAWRDERLDAVHRRNARRVYRTIVVLQGLFIKVGQLLSILANFLPEVFRSELEGLQDQVPPRPFEEIAARIEAELGAPVDTLFDDFRRTPIASASLGQVHEARTKDGRHVCVKVQHVNVDEVVRLDLITMRRIIRIVQWFVPVQGLEAFYPQIRELLKQELDFALEAEHIESIAKNFTSDPLVVFPTPIHHLSTTRVLTTMFLDGRKLSDTAGLDAMGIDKKDVARRLVRAYCQMIFVDGVYHADPHPGNILVRSDGALVLLDFGAIAELSPEMREGIPEFLEGALRRDTDRLIKALRKMGFIAKTGDETVSAQVVEYLHSKFQEEIQLESLNLKDVRIDPQRGLERLLDLRRMNIGLKELSGAFVVPKDWVLLERTMLLLYGCCALLDPELNPVALIQPYLQEFVLGNRDWTEIAMQAVRDAALGAFTLPEAMHKTMTRAARGQIEFRVRGAEDTSSAVVLVGRQLAITAIGIFGGYEAVELHLRGEWKLARVFIVIAGVSGVLLLGTWMLGPSRRR